MLIVDNLLAEHSVFRYGEVSPWFLFKGHSAIKWKMLQEIVKSTNLFCKNQDKNSKENSKIGMKYGLKTTKCLLTVGELFPLYYILLLYFKKWEIIFIENNKRYRNITILNINSYLSG